MADTIISSRRSRLTLDQLRTRSWKTHAAAEKQFKASRIPTSGEGYMINEVKPGSWQVVDVLYTESDDAATGDNIEVVTIDHTEPEQETQGDIIAALRQPEQAIARYEAMCAAIAECYRIDDVRDWRDRAAAIQEYHRRAQNTEAEHMAAEIRVRAERRAGELLHGMPKAKGGEQYHRSPGDTGASATTTLADMGISKNEASRAQRLADVPVEQFEEELRGPEVPRASGIIRKHSSSSASSKPRLTSGPGGPLTTSAMVDRAFDQLRSYTPTVKLPLAARLLDDLDAAEMFDRIPDMTVQARETFGRLVPKLTKWLAMMSGH
jgi:hypothetical protein